MLFPWYANEKAHREPDLLAIRWSRWLWLDVMSQSFKNDSLIFLRFPQKPSTAIMRKVINCEFHQRNSMPRQQISTSLVVNPSLLAPGYPAYGWSLVEQFDGFLMWWGGRSCRNCLTPTCPLPFTELYPSQEKQTNCSTFPNPQNYALSLPQYSNSSCQSNFCKNVPVIYNLCFTMPAIEDPPYLLFTSTYPYFSAIQILN